MLELTCWDFTNYPGESVFPSVASQVNFSGTDQKEHLLINRVITKKSTA
jgi:hypothetical protein